MNGREKIVAIDVDGVVVDSIEEWKKWLDNYKISADFDTYITDNEALSFWTSENLYDYLEPMRYSVEIIEQLYEKYYIIFISSCDEAHRASKIDFLNRHFKFHGFLDLQNKRLARYDILIDDSTHNLTENDIWFVDIDWLDIPQLIEEKLK